MPNYEAATGFLTDWWNGRKMPRPALFITAVKEIDPFLMLPLPHIEGVFDPNKSLKSAQYRLAYENNKIAGLEYFAEGMAIANPTIGPSTYSYFFGGTPIEDRNTVWVDPWYKSILDIEIAFDENNQYWRYQIDLLNRMMEFGKDKFVVAPPTTTDGLDILSSMLGPQQLLYDIMDHPDAVIEKNAAIGDFLLKMFDTVYKTIGCKGGGSIYLFWSEGKMLRHQCDFSAMLSPSLFRQFALPQLRRTMGSVDHTIYHWDGPGALCHLDALLETEEIDVIQWTPGAGIPPSHDRKWWKMYHKILDSGKNIQIATSSGVDEILLMKKEFGRDFPRFMIIFGRAFPSAKEAADAVELLTL